MNGALRKSGMLLILLALFIAVSAAIAAPAGKGQPNAPGPDRGRVVETVPAAGGVDPQSLGCILPLTGRFASYGTRALDTLILAAGLFDPKKKSPVKLLIEDSQSKPDMARAGVTKLVRSGVIAIIGSLGSEEAQAAAEEAQRLKVPILTFTQKEGITDAGNYVFRNFLTGSLQVKTLAKYARENLRVSKFAVLYPDDAYSKDMVTLFQKEVSRRQGKITWAQSYKSDQTSYSEEIKKFTSEMEIVRRGGDVPGQPPPRSFNFDALFIPGSHTQVKMIVPHLVLQDARGIRLLGLNGWNSRALLSMDDGSLEGAVFTDGFFADSINPEAIDFVDVFYAAYSREPDVMEAQVFDTAGMAVKIIREKTGDTREKFRDSLAGIRGYPGVTGRTSFSATRDAEKEAFLLTVKDGKIVQIK